MATRSVCLVFGFVFVFVVLPYASSTMCTDHRPDILSLLKVTPGKAPENQWLIAPVSSGHGIMSEVNGYGVH